MNKVDMVRALEALVGHLSNLEVEMKWEQRHKRKVTVALRHKVDVIIDRIHGLISRVEHS